MEKALLTSGVFNGASVIGVCVMAIGGKRRNKAFQEQRLTRAAVAAGAAFGWSDADFAVHGAGTGGMSTRRMLAVAVPTLVFVPFAVSMALQYIG